MRRVLRKSSPDLMVLVLWEEPRLLLAIGVLKRVVVLVEASPSRSMALRRGKDDDGSMIVDRFKFMPPALFSDAVRRDESLLSDGLTVTVGPLTDWRDMTAALL